MWAAASAVPRVIEAPLAPSNQPEEASLPVSAREAFEPVRPVASSAAPGCSAIGQAVSLAVPALPAPVFFESPGEGSLPAATMSNSYWLPSESTTSGQRQ